MTFRKRFKQLVNAGWEIRVKSTVVIISRVGEGGVEEDLATYDGTGRGAVQALIELAERNEE